MEVEKSTSKENMINLDEILEILGNPTRRVILSKLAKVPHSTSELHKALGISRQAVHSQLEILSNYNIIEKIHPDKRGGRYRIKSTLSVKIDITPDYYGVKYNIEEVKKEIDNFSNKKLDSSKYEQIKKPNEKLKFLGEKIKSLENNIEDLERERQELLRQKECFIVELKNLIEKDYKENLRKSQSNLEKEIFFTLFFNPQRYIRRAINIDNLLEDLFFSDMDFMDRHRNRASIELMLRDLSKTIDLLTEKDESWFFDL